MNHKNQKRIYRVIKVETGYTLVEVIIAIAICGFGLATVLGLYGIGFKTAMVSKNILEQSLAVNSISDEIRRTIDEPSRLSLPDLEDKVAATLIKYPDYTLKKIRPGEQPDLQIIEISQQSLQSKEKLFFIKVYWRTP
ncbi:MAG: type IV pilus modification PilV family protein [Acetobacterium sp.]